MIAHHAQIAVLRKGLLQRVVEGVRRTEDAAQVVVHTDLIANASPINVGAVMRRQPDGDNENQKQDSPRSQSATPVTLALPHGVFDQPNHAKEDEQQRPPMSEPMPDGN